MSMEADYLGNFPQGWQIWDSEAATNDRASGFRESSTRKAVATDASSGAGSSHPEPTLCPLFWVGG